MFNPRGFHAFAVIACAVLTSGSALAQGTAVLTGTVRDASNKKPLHDAVVTVTSPSLQGEQTVLTDGGGQFRVPNLPPGPYSIRIDADAFRPYSRGGINLRIDTTIRLDSLLLPEGIRADEVVVVAAAPTVDVGSSTTGVNVSSDFASRIALNPPSGKGAATRSFESLAEIAPGAAADQFGVSISGTTSPENQYVIDGLSVNNPAFGILGTPLSVEFVKEVNVITGGYMPEYGRATGGYLDVVTKTGSNEFHGSIFTSLTPGAFEAHRKEVIREGSTITTSTSLAAINDIGADLGGPILKDRLWFYIGFSPSSARFALERDLNKIRLGADGMPVKSADGFTQTDRLPGTTQQLYATQSNFQGMAKLTWLVNPNNTVTLSVSGAHSTSGGQGTYGISPRDGMVEIANANSNNILNGSYAALAHQYVSTAIDPVLKWSSSFNNKHILFDATLGWHKEQSATRAADGTALGSGQGLSAVSQVFWQRTDPGPHSINDFERSAATASCGAQCPVSTYYSGGPGFLNEAGLDRWQAKGVGTGLFTGLGHHVVKAGVDFEVMRYESRRGYSGSNVYYETTDGKQFTDFRRFGFLVGPDQAVTPEQFQAVSKSTTVGGFVQDSWSLLDKVTVNVGLRYDAQLLYGYDDRLAMTLPNQFSPRVGVIYDVTQSGRSKIFVNYARFYESVPLDAIDRSIPGERQFTSTHDASLCDPRSVSQQKGVCDSDQSRVVTGAAYAPNQRWSTVGSDKSPVDPDIQPQSTDEIVAGGEYEVIPNARVGAQYTKRWQNRVIEDMSRDEAQTYFIGNPGYGIAKDFPKPVRDYDAVTVYVQKTFSNTWLAQASYTASYLRGNWAGLFHPETGQLDPNINSDFDLISLLANRMGPLPGDHTHSIKLYGAKDFLVAERVLFNLGVTYRGRSGDPTTYFGSHPIYGADQVYILPRGSGERLPWVHDVDAHLGVGVKLTKESTASFSIDFFNLFDFQQMIAKDQRYTQANVKPIVDGTPADLGKLKNTDGTPFAASDKNLNFGNPTAYQPPLSVRLGARVTF